MTSPPPLISLFSTPASTALFLSHNESLAPPYRVLVDTNFINLSYVVLLLSHDGVAVQAYRLTRCLCADRLENRIDLETGMMDSLYAKCIPCVSDCVMAELEKLGPKYRLALK